MGETLTTAQVRALARRTNPITSDQAVTAQQAQPGLNLGALLAPQAPRPTTDIAGLIKALAPVRRGIGGEEITNDNPMGYAGGDPWKNGTFQHTAANTDPAVIAASQGNTAANQWEKLRAQPGGITPEAIAAARATVPISARGPIGTVTGVTPAEQPQTGGAGYPLGVNLQHLIAGSVTNANPAGQVWSGAGQTIGAGPVTNNPNAPKLPMRYVKGLNGQMIPVAQ